MASYKDTRNGLLGSDFSTKLSAWLALGCITARQVHHQLVAYEDGTDGGKWKHVAGYGKGENKGTAAVRFELLWRDYMRLCTRKFGPRLFRQPGFRNDTSTQWTIPPKPTTKTNNQNQNQDPLTTTLTRFLNGTTGTGLIDASQRELLLTGYTSNRARQNVASFLTKHLHLSWLLGAEWYESQLVDYDVSSNWANWQYVAGVGNDPRAGGEGRVFNPVKQAGDYDPRGEYIRAWVPELRGLEKNDNGGGVEKLFQCWKMDEEEKRARGLVGNVMVEEPLKRIEFRGGRRGGNSNRGGGGGGRGGRGGGEGGGGRRGPGQYGGSSRNNNHSNNNNNNRKGKSRRDDHLSRDDAGG
jgi:deoxyribodipyrimidine photo-lyase